MRIVKWMPTLAAVLLSLISVPFAAADPIEGTADTPGTPAAGPGLSETDRYKAVDDYIEAFNSGDDAVMARFFEEHFAQESLEKRPADVRMQMYHRLRQDMGDIVFRRVLPRGPHGTNVLVKSSKNDWFQLHFEFQEAAPFGITGIGVEQVEGAETPESKPEAELVPSVEKTISALVAKDEFSGAVLLAKGGKPVFERACGMASQKNGIPNQMNTKFNIGSINKTFTAAAIGLLAKDGKLKLDDTIDRYLPEFPADKSKITIRQLLNHRSGMGDFFGDAYNKMSKGMLRKNSDFIPLFINKPLEFPPGSSEKYSNAGYVTLGAIIEKVSGQSYYEYVREHIFKPLGMLNTDSYMIDEETSGIATGYTRHQNDENQPGTTERRSNVETLPARGSAAGGGYSTAGDLLKFALALQKREIPLPTEEGDSQGPVGPFAFAGGSPGVNAVVALYPVRDYVLVVLSNYDPPSAEQLEKQIGGWIRNLR